MADYSGAWHCDECHASGTAYEGNHQSWCSVTERRAKMEREQKAKELAARQRKQEIREVWDTMDDDTMLDKWKKIKALVKEYEKELDPIIEEAHIATRLVMERRLDWRDIRD